MEPLNAKSQIPQEYGLLPADARQQSPSQHDNKVLRREDCFELVQCFPQSRFRQLIIIHWAASKVGPVY